MKFNYISTYTPAAPVVELWLGAPEAMPVIGPLAALIDTGADGSLVPVRYLRAIPSLTPVDRRWLRSHWGESRMVTLSGECRSGWHPIVRHRSGGRFCW